MSSGTVQANSRDVRLFASQLKQFNADLANSAARLRAQLRQLGITWKDPQYVKFEQEFDQTIKNLQRFREYSDQVIPRLIKFADHIDATPHV